MGANGTWGGGERGVEKIVIESKLLLLFARARRYAAAAALVCWNMSVSGLAEVVVGILDDEALECDRKSDCWEAR